MERNFNASDVLVATFNADPFAAEDYLDDVQEALDAATSIEAHTSADPLFEDLAAMLDLDPATVSTIYTVNGNYMTFALEKDC